jgi:hypothetical protein
MAGANDRTDTAAYGFRVEGIEDRDALAVRAASCWPVLRVERCIDPDPGPPGARVTASEASIQTPAARLVLDRFIGKVAVHSRKPVADAELVHPCLWPAAAVFARWLGAETLHAGAFVGEDGGAWAILGERGSGKSTMLAALALVGRQVLADDLVVLDGHECFAGPRFIDLRPEAVAALGVEARTSSVRSTQRRRLPLPPSEGRFPLRGFVYLASGDRLAIEPMAPAEHFGMLARHRRVAALGADLDQLLDLAGLPAMRIRRPRQWDGLADVREALQDAVAAYGP